MAPPPEHRPRPSAWSTKPHPQWEGLLEPLKPRPASVGGATRATVGGVSVPHMKLIGSADRLQVFINSQGKSLSCACAEFTECVCVNSRVWILLTYCPVSDCVASAFSQWLFLMYFCTKQRGEQSSRASGSPVPLRLQLVGSSCSLTETWILCSSDHHLSCSASKLLDDTNIYNFMPNIINSLTKHGKKVRMYSNIKRGITQRNSW